MVFQSLFILSHLCVFISGDNGLVLVMLGPRQHYFLFSLPSVYIGVSRPTVDNSIVDKKKEEKILPKRRISFFSLSFFILQQSSLSPQSAKGA